MYLSKLQMYLSQFQNIFVERLPGVGQAQRVKMTGRLCQRRLSDPVCFIDFLILAHICFIFSSYLFYIFFIFVSYFPQFCFILVWKRFLSLSRMSCLSYLETFLLGPRTDRESKPVRGRGERAAAKKKAPETLWRACGINTSSCNWQK